MVEAGHYITIAIFLATQAGTLIWFLASTRADSRVLKAQMESVRREMEKLGNVLVTLSDFSGRMNLFEERHTMTGKRLDDITVRVNTWMDKRDEMSRTAG